MTKYIFVTGGVVSSLGKGIVSASLGRLLKSRGYKVSIQKLDPYLNVDPGTMSPYQHGEVFVTDDGAETDLDLGHYERFIDENLQQSNSVTSGKIYSDVIAKERRGEYLGGTVQMVPHVTNEIKDRIRKAAEKSNADILIVEVGGTVGDIESSIFLEAIRQFKKDAGKNNSIYIHVTLVPNIKVTNELKTKPTQHSVELLRSKGIHPNILVLRAEQDIPESLKEKLSLFTDVPYSNIIESSDCESIYEVPLILEHQGLANRVLDELDLENTEPSLSSWKNTVSKIKTNADRKLKVALVGKYVKLSDAYISVIESLRHACAESGHQFDLRLVLSDDINSLEDAQRELANIDAICIPGGFGDRGIEGKLLAIQYARSNDVPLLGLCLGLQCLVIEYARNVLNLENANSIEFNTRTPDPVIHLMSEQEGIEDKGGTMRLGSYPCLLAESSKALQAYQDSEQVEMNEDNLPIIQERHRHRYEFNNKYKNMLDQAGLKFSGTSPDGLLVEIVEVSNHPYMLACQFHPEFKSRPDRPHPLFLGLIKAAARIKSEVSSTKTSV
ncbi:MAG: CTP synthase [Candidatus Caenarcaniphilales bacterium]|nr:CTP synthase [Candidatus Caenarcaniphilales bacterium]